MSKEVGSGHVAILPTFVGLRSAIKKEVDSGVKDAGSSATKGLSAAGASGGKALGGGLKSALESTAGDLNARTLKTFQAGVASAASKLSAARLKQADDAGRVRVAEQKLTEAVQKYGEGSSQAVAAQERLASAQRRLAESNSRVQTASDALAQAQSKLKSVQDSLGPSAEKSASKMQQAWQGAKSAMTSVASGVKSAFDAAMSGVKRVAGDAATAVKSSFKAAGALVAATLGVALEKGFARLEAIDTAKTKLKALGNTTAEVDKLMKGALDSVKGTAFGLGDAVSAAASIKAAHVPIELVNSALKSVASTAAVAGADMGEMGNIFAKVAAQQKLDGATVLQLQKHQVAILPMIADYYKVSGEEAKKMVSEGKVSFADFVKITGQLGDAAKVMGTGFKGMVANVGAALGRLGATVLQPVFDGLKAVMPGVISVIDQVTGAVKPLFEMIGAHLVPAMQRLGDMLSKIRFDGSGLARFKDMLGPLLPVIGGLVGMLGALLGRLPLIGGLFGGITGPLGIAVGLFAALFAFKPEQLASGFATLIPTIVDGLSTLLDKAVAIASDLLPKMASAIAANLPILLGGMLTLVQELVATLGAALPVLIQEVAKILPGLITTILGMIPGLLTVALTLFQTLIQAIVTIAPKLISTLIGILPSLITAVLKMLPQILQAAMTLFLGLVTGLLQALPQIVTALVNMLPQLITTLVGMIPQLINTAVTLFLALVVGLANALPDILTALVNMLPKLITTLIGMIPQLIVAAVQVFLALVLGLVQALPKILIALVNILPKLISTLIGMIPQLIVAAIQVFVALAKAIPQALPQIVAALVAMGPKFVTAVMKIGPQLLDAGKKLIGKLIDGIKAMFSAVGDAVGGVMDFVKGFFPHSPAKRGPFSGSGWTQLGESGSALIAQFQAGVDRAQTNVPLTARIGAAVAGAAGAGFPDKVTLVDASGALLGVMDVRIQQNNQRSALTARRY